MSETALAEAGTATPTQSDAPKVGLLSPCGWGNLGDVAIQEAVIGAFRDIIPDIDIVGFTLVPEDTRERHGIPSFPLAGRGTQGHTVMWRDDPGPDGPVMRWARTAEDRLFDIRYVGRLWTMGVEAVRTAWIEARHLALVGRWARELDLLMASGGGQLNEYWGGAFGQPFSLFKWSQLSRWHGTPFVMAGVGVGTMRSRLGRFFLRRAVLSAREVTCRDWESCEMVRELVAGRRTPDELPDLAFALVDPDAWPESPARRSPNGVSRVAVSPIAFRDPRVWPENDAEYYRGYVERLGRACLTILNSGRQIVLVATARADRRTATELQEWLAEEGWDEPDVVNAEVTTFEGLQECLDDVDAVVASRLHGVLLSHLADRPVLALSYNRKVRRHMEAMGQARYTLDIDDFGTDDVADLLSRLVEDRDSREELRRSVREHAGRARGGLRGIVRSHLASSVERGAART